MARCCSSREQHSTIERRNRFAQPDRDVAGVNHARKTLDERRELDEALSSLTGRGACAGEPRARRARRGARGTRDVTVTEMSDLADEPRLTQKRGRDEGCSASHGKRVALLQHDCIVQRQAVSTSGTDLVSRWATAFTRGCDSAPLRCP